MATESPSGEASTARILVTDQDANSRAVACRVLEAEHECDQSACRVETREWLGQGDFELSICDMHLPGDAGVTLAEEILVEHPDVSLVCVSGWDHPALARRADELGADGYLVKPYRHGPLLSTVRRALRDRELERDRQDSLRTLNQLQEVLDWAPLSIYVKDREHRFLFANRTSCESLGADRARVLGTTVADFMTPEASRISFSGDDAVFATGMTYEAEERLTMGGEDRALLTKKFPLRDEDGNVYAVCGISADITAEKQAERLRLELVAAQQEALQLLNESHAETVERLARTVRLRDSDTGDHVHRMARVCGLLGTAMGLEEDLVELLVLAAPMHDVGKIGFPDEILLKPGPLTDQERALMQRHTTAGYELLEDSESVVLRLAGEIAHTHHERWDGTGYPRGLAGRQIPVEGRIVAVADAFDALLSDRPYRPAMDLEQALEVVTEGSGSQFDPAVVEALLDHLDEALEARGEDPPERPPA